MRIETARRIIVAGAGRGVELECRESYSGRGMFGEKTAAIVHDDDSGLMAAIAVAAREGMGEEEFEDFLEDVAAIRRDSMGCQSVVY